MRLRQVWVMAAIAVTAQGGAAFAEVTVSQSNSPSLGMAEQIATLMGVEHAAIAPLPTEKLAALAAGPKGAPKRGTPGSAEAVNAAIPVSASARAGSVGASVARTGAMPALIRYEDGFLAALPTPAGDAQWECLRTALYFEARGESLRGQFAVAEVILNRVDSPKYPSTVCGVVQQGSSKGCQFSYVCDGKRDVMADRASADRAGRIARLMLDGAPRALTAGATHFHTRAVRPGWAHRFPRTAAIGAHLFYRQP